ncbi:ATP-binding cassette domain-containing protein [Pseudofrankia sp. BMG5.36]|uniref:ABC transporter permease subunit n=1 Tax=Pseudofrankia sp. BMG5.36 TaxID=1834512 RepID=UPI0008DB1476|nr:ATP-binding cassette domain-containing protein [Pseudofrankia sp. BMG5.36]OHV48808.1 ABC transporter [Pseudofrankia sp. BMG5.36]
MDKFFSLVLSGGVSGAVYSLLAIGLVLNYQTARIFNFGHGATAFSAAFLFYQLNTGLGWSKWAALVVTVFLFAPLAGLLWDRLVFRRLAGAGEAAATVASVGILITMPALVQWFCDVLRGTFGVGFVDTSTAYVVPGIGPNPPRNFRVTSGLVISSNQLIALVVALVAFLGLWLLLRFTALGLRMRAAVDKPELVRLRGTNTNTTSGVAWVLSFFLAGLAGVLAAPLPGTFGLTGDNYTLALFVAATAAVIAGLRSFPVAFLAGLLIGAARNLAEGYVSGQYLGPVGSWIEGVYGLRSSLPYWVLIVALVVVGMERRRRVAGTSSEATPPPDYLADLPRWRRHLPWVVAGALLLIYGLFLADSTWRTIVLSGLALAIVFMSFTVVTGLGGMVSLAQSTFVTVAALSAGWAVGHGWPFLLALLLGVVAATAIGVVVALPALRLGGVALTLATLALALLGFSVLFNIAGFTNGTEGWRLAFPAVGSLDFADDRVMVVVLFVLVLAVAGIVGNLERSAAGRAMAAVRSSAPGAAASGVPLGLTKLTIFGVSAALAGFGGVLLACVQGTARGFSWPPIMGFLWLATVVIFGVRRPQGAIVAGLVSVALPRVISHGLHLGSVGWSGTSSPVVAQILFGLGAIGLAQQPEGTLASVSALRHRRRLAARPAGVTDTATAVMPGTLPLGVTSPALAAPAGGPASAPAGSSASPAGSPLLELRGVRAGYGEVEVLHGLDLAVAPGGVLTLLGANGAGKSTLCRTVAGLTSCGAGRVLFRGEDVTAAPAHERSRMGIVLVPESRGIFPSLTVEENLQLWLRDQALRDGVYDRFPNLAARRGVEAGNLSGGEQQMLSLAPFIARPPALLLADEPTLGLSVKVAGEVLAALRVLRDEGTTLILVEEKAQEVLTLADQVGALSLGRLQWLRAAADLDPDELTSAYLGGAATV